MIIVGIDLGLTGGIVVLEDGKILSIHNMPVLQTVVNGKKRDMYDVNKIIELCKYLKICTCVFIEKVQPINMPNSSKGANFSQGYAKGIFETALAMLNIKYELVSSQEWQKHFGIVKPKDSKGWSTKGPAYNVAIKLFPESYQMLTTPKGRILDGRSDALLVAVYGERKMHGQTK